MNVEYIKDYKYKELKQFVLAYLLIAVASVGFYIKDTIGAVGLLSALSSMIAIDTLAGAICALVFILNEFWPDKVKQQIIYKDMPSDTVFTDIASDKIDAAGFDLAKSKRNVCTFIKCSSKSANRRVERSSAKMQRCRAWKCYRRRTDAVDDERYLYVNNFSVGYDTYRIWGFSSCLHELSDGNQNTIHPARVPCNNVVCDKESRQESSQSHCSVSN